MDELVNQVLEIWSAGGALMIPLFALGCFIYLGVFELYLYLRKNNYLKYDENEWRHWIDSPEEGKGELGDIIKYTQDGCKNTWEIRNRISELRAAHIPRIESRIHFANILIGTAPLAGLLGTVMGMLNTFFGMSTGSGGDTIDLVAGGISEALITTQTGLVLAIPAYVIISNLKKQSIELDVFFTRLEIFTIIKHEKGHKNLTIV